MKAMVVKKCWFSSILEQQEVNVPEIKDNEVMIKVCSSGVNRDDIIDVVTSDEGVCPGLECSGIIEAVGRSANCWKVGEKVCAILEGGGYAEKVAVPANFLLPLPDDIDLDDAAGLPYASCRIWLSLFNMCDRKTLKDKKILSMMTNLIDDTWKSWEDVSLSQEESLVQCGRSPVPSSAHTQQTREWVLEEFMV